MNMQRQTRGVKFNYNTILKTGTSDSEEDIEEDKESSDEDFDPEQFKKEEAEMMDCDYNPDMDFEEHYEAEYDDEDFLTDDEEEDGMSLAADALPVKCTDTDKYMCSICFENFDLEIETQDHCRLQHNFPFNCESCEKVFRTERGKDSHIDTIHAVEHHCTECLFSTDSYLKLRKHIRENHVRKLAPRYTYICHICGYQCQLSTQLDTHLYSTHDVGERPEKKFVCEVCGIPFLTKREVVQHRVNHENKTVPCTYEGCKRLFLSKNTMMRHYNSSHLGLRRFSCDVEDCNVTFMNRAAKKLHMDMVHLKIRTFVCTWEGCTKTFYAQKHLSIHMLIHSDEKPLKCEFCDYSCRQRTALNWHVTKKHGVKKESKTTDDAADSFYFKGCKPKPGRKAKTDGKSRSRYKQTQDL